MFFDYMTDNLEVLHFCGGHCSMVLVERTNVLYVQWFLFFFYVKRQDTLCKRVCTLLVS
jgi:hypothetical protein